MQRTPRGGGVGALVSGPMSCGLLWVSMGLGFRAVHFSAETEREYYDTSIRIVVIILMTACQVFERGAWSSRNSAGSAFVVLSNKVLVGGDGLRILICALTRSLIVALGRGA